MCDFILIPDKKQTAKIVCFLLGISINGYFAGIYGVSLLSGSKTVVLSSEVPRSCVLVGFVFQIL